MKELEQNIRVNESKANFEIDFTPMYSDIFYELEFPSFAQFAGCRIFWLGVKPKVGVTTKESE